MSVTYWVTFCLPKRSLFPSPPPPSSPTPPNPSPPSFTLLWTSSPFSLQEQRTVTYTRLERGRSECRTQEGAHAPVLSGTGSLMHIKMLLTLGAHARGLQYLSCLSLCVCVCVCFPYSGTSRNQAYKQQYQRLQRDTGMKYKKGFFFKTLRSEVMASFTHLE